MSNYIDRAGLQVDSELANFVEQEALPGLDLDAASFWQSLASVVNDLTPINKALLAKRESLQVQLDEWNVANKDSFDPAAYKAFLTEIGYLVEEGGDFKITTEDVDDEIAKQAGAQLVVPTSNARFALNATNARWGSLYDALYGTDAISEEGGAHKSGPYNEVRGAKVIQFAKDFLDQNFPLELGSHANVIAYKIENGALAVDIDGGQNTGLAN